MKQDITKHFDGIYLKMRQWWDRDYSLGNDTTLAIEKRKHFTKLATERCSSNLCLAAIINIV